MLHSHRTTALPQKYSRKNKMADFVNSLRYTWYLPCSLCQEKVSYTYRHGEFQHSISELDSQMSDGIIARNPRRVSRTLRVSKTNRGFMMMGAHSLLQNGTQRFWLLPYFNFLRLMMHTSRLRKKNLRRKKSFHK